jgi:cob(I)alamin adenosyltransferase
MKIYTKTGDDGTTGLFNGERTQKDNLRVETYGTIDELNTIIGIAITFETNAKLIEDLIIVQKTLFKAGTDFASPLNPPPKWEIKRIDELDFKWLESKIDEYTSELEPLKNFILPGGSKSAGFLHQARAVSRRAERQAVGLARTTDLGNHILIYINRLSDYLFTAARYANFTAGIADVINN